jgi:hypothetical protein
MPAGGGSIRQDGGNERSRNAEGLYLDSKAAPASTQISTEHSATAKGHSAGPSAASHGVTAATAASAIPAHVTSGNMNVGSQGVGSIRKDATLCRIE